jgi:hypothetical protein
MGNGINFLRNGVIGNYGEVPITRLWNSSVQRERAIWMLGYSSAI